MNRGPSLCLIGESGKLKPVRISRWGNPEGAAFDCVNFGGLAEKERTFDGYTAQPATKLLTRALKRSSRPVKHSLLRYPTNPVSA